jgi:hypothetical protein
MIRESVAIALGALLLTNPAPGVSQRRDKEKEFAFVIFLQSVAAQGTARLCVRGIPGYREQFDRSFALWRDKYRDRIAMGEAAFREERAKAGLTPEYRAKLEEVDKVMAALSTPPAESGPLAIDDRWREECERILADLNKELR